MFLKVDENQHRFGYDSMMSCDMKRMTDVQATVIQSDDDIPPIYWMRYNPNTVHVDGVTVRIPREDRHKHLIKQIKNVTPSDVLRIEYMYYDTTNGVLDVFDNPEYSEYLKQHAFKIVYYK